MDKILKIFDKEIRLKFLIVIVLFIATAHVLRLFQNNDIYNLTLDHFTLTYKFYYDKNGVTHVDAVKNQYTKINKNNIINWDASQYKRIKNNYYDNGKWEGDYAFFPLFPLLWKILYLNDYLIGLFNYFLFGLSIIILSSLFFPKLILSQTERLCVFMLSLILPTIVVYYIPYAEALYTFTFVMAIWGLVKNKYWVYFVFIILFSMTRPTIIVFAISIVMLDLLYFLKHRNVVHFVKELALKLIPAAIGVGIVFSMYYLNSGSFTKYFEAVSKYWPQHFGFPHKIADWSIEGFGMNVFAIFFVIIPSAILFLFNALKHIKSAKPVVPQSVFNGNFNFIKEYFLNNSIIHFWGVFLCIFFYQDGSLNGLSRYVFVSPFFYIFYFIFYSELRDIKIKKLLYLFIPAFCLSAFTLLTAPKYLQPQINFHDMGFFCFFFSLVFLISLKYLNNTSKKMAFLVVAFFNIVWITFLYNIYICDGWLFT